MVRLSKSYHPAKEDDLPCWAKCDLVANVGTHRLNGFKVGRRICGDADMTDDDLKRVRAGVLHGLGFGALLKSE